MSARRKRRSSGEIVARILEAASAEFERSGYVGATTAAIARQAEVTEAQLFRCFATKATLFQAAIFRPLNDHFCGFRSRAMGLADTTASSRDLAEQYIAELQQFIGEHSRMLMSLIVAQTYAATNSPNNSQGVGEIDGLAAYFDRGAAMMASRVAAPAAVDPQLMVRVSFAAVLASVTFKDWLFPLGLASDEQIAAAISAFVIDGIGANGDPGLKPQDREDSR
jgi:AcrR family transcriptional regulator